MNEGATQCCCPVKLHNLQTFLKLSLLPEANGVPAYRLTPRINGVDGGHQNFSPTSYRMSSGKTFRGANNDISDHPMFPQ